MNQPENPIDMDQNSPETSEPRTRRKPSRGAYLIPSLFTVGSMALGFYSIVLGLRGEFQLAVLLIFLAAFLDGLDGRIARVTMTESDFGREYDSLADLMTFGVAPALLCYLWGLDTFGRIGWLVPFLFAVCAATRLARFNVHTGTQDKRFFVGLPAPAAAGGLGSLLYVADASIDASTETLLAVGRLGLLSALLIFGLLMLSTFRYYSFKELDPRRRWSFRIVVPIALTLLLVVLHPPAVFLLVSGAYALSGPLLWLKGRIRPGAVEALSSEALDSTAGSRVAGSPLPLAAHRLVETADDSNNPDDPDSSNNRN